MLPQCVSRIYYAEAFPPSKAVAAAVVGLSAELTPPTPPILDVSRTLALSTLSAR
jgi:hypothetical protein